MEELPDASQRVVAAGRAAGVEVRLRRFPEGTRTSADAAAAIGCRVAAIAKTLVLHDEEGPLIVFASGANRVDFDKVAVALGTTGVRKADADEARAATGYAIGGTAPFGHPRRLRTLIDEALLGLEEVWAAGGTPDTVFPLTPEVLLTATGATVAEVAENRGKPAAGS